MVRKMIVKLDKETIPTTIINEIENRNSNLKNMEYDIYNFEFDETELLHASLILNNNQRSLGYDIGYYLQSAYYILQRLPQSPNQYLVLDVGPPDFKKRASEDFGVGISSLFMHKSFGVRWQNISQIPANQKFSKFRPDFIAKEGNREFIFETKGTTQAHKISEVMGKAIQQAKSYSGSAISKLAFVSYFPNSRKIFPSYLFLSDPPIQENFHELDRWFITMTHYIKVLKICGFTRSYKPFIDVIIDKFRLKKEEERPYWYSTDIDFERYRGILSESFYEDYQILEKNQSMGRDFIGKYVAKKVKVGSHEVSVFLGVDEKIIKNIISLNVDIPVIGNKVIDEDKKKVSVFSDGTIMEVMIE